MCHDLFISPSAHSLEPIYIYNNKQGSQWGKGSYNGRQLTKQNQAQCLLALFTSLSKGSVECALSCCQSVKLQGKWHERRFRVLWFFLTWALSALEWAQVCFEILLPCRKAEEEKEEGHIKMKAFFKTDLQSFSFPPSMLMHIGPSSAFISMPGCLSMWWVHMHSCDVTFADNQVCSGFLWLQHKHALD